MHVQDMAQNSSFLDEINREATKVWANTHFQKSLPGKGISLKTTQTFIMIFWELYSVVLRPICKEFIFPVSKFLKFFVCFVMLLTAPAPNYGTLSEESRWIF